MLNSIRNCLLNERPPRDEPAPPWDRYMPDEFIPKNLPSFMETVRRLLVGTGRWWDKTLHVEQILSVIFSARFSPFSAWPDSRITSPNLYPAQFNFSNNLIALNAGAKAAASAALIHIEDLQRVSIRRMWNITVGPGPALEIEIDGKRWEAALSTAVPLAEDIGFFVDPTGLQIGSEWRVISYTRNRTALTDIFANLGKISQVSIENIFTSALPEEKEPLKQFKRMFISSKFEADRLAGLVFAFVRKYFALSV